MKITCLNNFEVFTYFYERDFHQVSSIEIEYRVLDTRRGNSILDTQRKSLMLMCDFSRVSSIEFQHWVLSFYSMLDACTQYSTKIAHKDVRFSSSIEYRVWTLSIESARNSILDAQYSTKIAHIDERFFSSIEYWVWTSSCKFTHI